jgi:hypothetical protein
MREIKLLGTSLTNNLGLLVMKKTTVMSKGEGNASRRRIQPTSPAMVDTEF